MTEARFLALAGDPAALVDRLRRLTPPRHDLQRLNRVFDAPNLVIFASPETPLIELDDKQGLLIGGLFRGSAQVEPVAALSSQQSRHAAWSGGRSLFEEMWGGYAIFTRDKDEIAILRDPTGAIPVYNREAGGIQLFCSALDLAGPLQAQPCEPDEEALRQWLTFPALRTARTGLVGWCELLPGTLRRWRPGADAVVETAWTPWRFAAADRQLRDFNEAARRLRELALATVPAQLTGIDRPLLELSGGLDSAIVAACLTSGGVEYRAANFATTMPDGDERDYARLAARHLGTDLAELHEDDRPLDLAPAGQGGLRPLLSPVLQPLHRALSDHAQRIDSSDFVTGAGGDNLFGYLTSAAPALDAITDRGLRAGWSTLQDVAELGECTIWTVGLYALRKRLRGAGRRPWRRDVRFLTPDAAACQPDRHPWLERPPGAAFGKVEQIESLVLIQHFLEPRYGTGEALHHPLISQPMMELCLQIPTWLWLRGGVNRAVARAAFADLLPPELIRRRSKGSLESMSARAFATNRAHLAGLLLDGELVRLRLIDRTALEISLQTEARALGDAHFRIFDLVSLELWLRSCRG